MEGKPAHLPTGLDEWDIFFLSMYERNWTTEDVENLPVRHASYIPVWQAARIEIDKDAQRRQ